jgi:hypothetical protein
LTDTAAYLGDYPQPSRSCSQSFGLLGRGPPADANAVLSGAEPLYSIYIIEELHCTSSSLLNAARAVAVAVFATGRHHLAMPDMLDGVPIRS